MVTNRIEKQQNVKKNITCSILGKKCRFNFSETIEQTGGEHESESRVKKTKCGVRVSDYKIYCVYIKNIWC